ncbi:transcriptional regulator [Paeniglutamicibacter cryotolerans]|uniref:DNA-binding MarR family transcriptional regulator n=1 Tax=Paeniglutamicibacter cryotolerans TaxID=670079 RepID=A0A839QXS9_9MICC|nr:transcriptional regulator [Paeniglutamicibacter cryotolerans]MBB2996771.1 DNA-binding MarR family transcriptional regulator [Paeniglutamicibacter cryotolerans]
MAELDPLIHADARLRVMSVLNTLGPRNSVSFPKLREILSMTAGNLSTHLRKLEDAGYISQTKVIEGRSPATYLGITATGMAAFDTYKKQLMELL